MTSTIRSYWLVLSIDKDVQKVVHLVELDDDVTCSLVCKSL